MILPNLQGSRPGLRHSYLTLPVNSKQLLWVATLAPLVTMPAGLQTGRPIKRLTILLSLPVLHLADNPKMVLLLLQPQAINYPPRIIILMPILNESPDDRRVDLKIEASMLISRPKVDPKLRGK